VGKFNVLELSSQVAKKVKSQKYKVKKSAPIIIGALNQFI
jgi:hypothetical protein